MVRLAAQFVSSQAVAEEVAQDAWLALVQGLERFEGRSTIRTWLLRVVANRARTRAKRDSRVRPFSSFGTEDDDGPTVDPERFLPADHRVAGHWASPVRPWGRAADEIAADAATRAAIEGAIARLPESQRAVITLRDLSGYESSEVCNILGLSEVNQRVLLHRARAAVRKALEERLA
jgi:RNA polymerase sigma-70 factor (ECF subfamily)